MEILIFDVFKFLVYIFTFICNTCLRPSPSTLSTTTTTITTTNDHTTTVSDDDEQQNSATLRSCPHDGRYSGIWGDLDKF
jgi:hypothetical protein